MVRAERPRIEFHSLVKIKELIKSARICLISNNVMDWPLSSISVNNQWIDDQGMIWLLFVKTSPESPLLEGGRIELFYANSGANEFLTLSGLAAVVTPDEIPVPRKTLPFSKTLESQALASAIGIISFQPTDAYYWDNQSSSTVRLPLVTSDNA